MLSEKEKHVLSLLEKLGASSLDTPEQTERVREISEHLQALQEDAEAAELLGQPAPLYPSFVKLCRRRLVEAQQQCLQNYQLLRASKTRRIIEQQPPQQDDTPKTPQTLETSNGAFDFDADEKFARSVHEAKSETITQVLQRMRGIAQAEIIRGELNIDELDMNSRTLRELQEKYSGVNVLLNGSRRLVQVLDEAERWDRYCMLASLGFLAAVMVYIVYRRILSGPVKILLWSLFQLVGIAKKVPYKSIPVSSDFPILSETVSTLSSVDPVSTVEPVTTVSSALSEPTSTLSTIEAHVDL